MIITSYLFPEAKFSSDRLKAVLESLGDDRNKLVIDLSCRRKGATWFVAMNKWQTITDLEVNEGGSGYSLPPSVSELIRRSCHKDAGASLLRVPDPRSRP